MIDVILLSVTAGVVSGLATYLIAVDVANWCKHRRLARIKRVEHELALTKQHLEALAMEHQAWLNARAHEARKALILESFLAPKDARPNTSSLSRKS